MLNTYLRLVVVVLAILVGLWLVAILIPLILKAAIAAAIILGVLFLINLFRKRACSP